VKNTLTIQEITMIGIFTAVTVVLAQISIPLPFTPIPISMGVVAVYIAGIMLKPKHALLTQLCYLLLGAVGIPVFANFRGGAGVLIGPTGGYLMVYPVVAFFIAIIMNSCKGRQTESTQSKKVHFLKAGLTLCVALLIMYLGGTIWLCIMTGSTFAAGLAMAVYPFIPLDIVKIVFCVMVIIPLRSRFLSMNLLVLEYEADAAKQK